ncbi:MAG TPA: hypothetical protein H9684_03590 [Firmicutes bacterium]|nr:hypothetical protein [Bacillota bacterium]
MEHREDGGQDGLRPEDRALLGSVAGARRYPLVRLELRSSRERELRSTALNHVRLERPDEGMEALRARGEALARLEEAGLIRLDYRPAVTVAADYAVYRESDVYHRLCELVAEGKTRPGFLFDTPHIRRGRAVLTARGRRLLAREQRPAAAGDAESRQSENGKDGTEDVV